MQTYQATTAKNSPTFAKLRKIARNRALKILATQKNLPTPIVMEYEDIEYLMKFVSESAFYVEELENMIGEDLIDFWQTREHALRIVTGHIIDANVE